MHPWVKGVQVSSNKGPRPFPRGDNYQKANKHGRNLKIFFSRTTGPISTKLGIKHTGMKETQGFTYTNTDHLIIKETMITPLQINVMI